MSKAETAGPIFQLPEDNPSKTNCQICGRGVLSIYTWWIWLVIDYATDARFYGERARKLVCGKCLGVARSKGYEPVLAEGDRGRILQFRLRTDQ